MTVKGSPGKKNPCPPGSKKAAAKAKTKKKDTPKASKKGKAQMDLAKPKKSGKMTTDDIADIKRRIEKQKVDRFKNRRLLPGKL